MDARVKPVHDECGKPSRDVLLSDDAESPKQNQIHGRRNRPRAPDRGFPPGARRSRAARGEREDYAVPIAPQPRFLQARRQEETGPLPTDDPRASGYVCGEADELQRRAIK